MWQDPIVAKVRRVRRAHAAQFGFDIEAIYNDLKAQEKRGQRRMISFPPRRVSPVQQQREG